MKNDNEKNVREKWGKTHTIEKVRMLNPEIDLSLLKDNESVAYGDGETFYWLLTEKKIN